MIHTIRPIREMYMRYGDQGWDATIAMDALLLDIHNSDLREMQFIFKISKRFDHRTLSMVCAIVAVPFIRDSDLSQIATEVL